MLNSENEQKYICIVDYNLTRVGDVRLLVEYAKSKYNLGSILLRANPNQIDRSLVDEVIDLGPRQDGFVEKAISALAPYASQIAALLPFSDDSVVAGAALAEQLGLKCDSSHLAERAFSKLTYREAETRFRSEFKAQNMFVPRNCFIRSVEDLSRCLSEWGSVVLKPSCEGNNRGVIKLTKTDSLEAIFTSVRPYMKDGLIAEELIPMTQEFSVDGIGDLMFSTRKLGHLGRYPVECGQIVPAKISQKSLQALTKASNLANLLVGQKIGPYHNEIKHDPSTLQCSVVEPNRRPAGMRIWHLAERAYGVNFFHLWIDQLMGKALPTELPPPQRSAGIKMLKSPVNGELRFNINHESDTLDLLKEITKRVETLVKHSFETFDFQWNIGAGASVLNEPKDNSQFMAQICFQTSDMNTDLEVVMNIWAREWEHCIRPFIINSTKNNKTCEAVWQ